MDSEESKEIKSVEFAEQLIRHYPDSEEKRHVQNLARKLDMHKNGAINRIDKSNEYKEVHEAPREIL